MRTTLDINDSINNCCYFIKITKEISDYVEKNASKFGELNIAVMGCVVNGPGESMNADIGLSIPGKGEEKTASVFIKGKFHKNLSGKNIANQFIEILEDFIYNSLP